MLNSKILKLELSFDNHEEEQKAMKRCEEKGFYITYSGFNTQKGHYFLCVKKIEKPIELNDLNLDELLF